MEFVLAPATESLHAATKAFKIEGVELVVWMLDFDCMREMSTDEAGIRQAVQAFYQNDPYFPRPYFASMTDSDYSLWAHFRACFLRYSGEMMEDENMKLSSRWMALVEEEGERRRIHAGAPRIPSAA